MDDTVVKKGKKKDDEKKKEKGGKKRKTKKRKGGEEKREAKMGKKDGEGIEKCEEKNEKRGKTHNSFSPSFPYGGGDDDMH